MEKNSENSAPIIAMTGVSKTFPGESGNGVVAVEAVDFTVEAGEFVTILGPTGCGKTTVLNLAAGLLAPDSGSVTVRVDGAVPCVFQHYTLFPWRTVLRNVMFGPLMRGIPAKESEEKARSLLGQVGLTGFVNAYPHELSGGMRQRAAIAQALALDPSLLLMDEPFGSLDDHTRREMQDLLAEIWANRHMTILFVTHNIDEALALGSRVIVFKGKPGRPADEIRVDLPRPRDRLSTDMTDFHIELRRLLADARN